MKKGFTLIELLAVIVILAIILLIAMPIILNVISESKKGAFEASTRGMVKTAENEYMKNALGGDSETTTYVFEDYIQIVGDLKFSGKSPRNGYIHVTSSGEVAVVLEDGTWLAKKELTEKDITIEILGEQNLETIFNEVIGVAIVVNCDAILIDDRDNNEYAIVQIGDQCWLKENLNYAVTGAVCYDNAAINCGTYGRLYTWNVAMANSIQGGAQGVCPTGWHVPTDEDWQIMEVNLGVSPSIVNETGYRGAPIATNMKEISPIWNGNNQSGFTGLPGGYRQGTTYTSIESSGVWWTSTEFGNNAWYRVLVTDNEGISRNNFPKSTYFSVRCIKDDFYTINYDANGGVCNQEQKVISYRNSLSDMDCTKNGNFLKDFTITSGSCAGDFDPLTGSCSDVRSDMTLRANWEETFPCGSYYRDSRDAQKYLTVQIGDQCWFKENHNYAITGAICYDNAAVNCETYGRLYTWNMAMANSAENGAQGVCPTGWHVPTDEDWQILEINLGMTLAEAESTEYRGAPIGTNMKEVSPIWNGNNQSGFTGLPGGYRQGTTYSSIESSGIWWTSTEFGANAWYRVLTIDNEGISRRNLSKSLYFSVRCIKDDFYTINYDANGGVCNQEQKVISYRNSLSDMDCTKNGNFLKDFTITSGSCAGDFDPLTGSCSDVRSNMTLRANWEETFPCGSYYRDSRDAQKYLTVQIGDQCWFKENLNYAVAGAVCYNNDALNCETYGKLYTWNMAMAGSTHDGAQGVCPTGWHISSDGDWKIMEMTLGMTLAEAESTEYRGAPVGTKMKQAPPIWNGNNQSGFTGLPGGYRQTTNYSSIETSGFWWTSTEFGTSAWYRVLGITNEGVARRTFSKDVYFSIRCVIN